MPLDLCSDLFSGVTSAGLRNFNSYSMLHSLYLDLILCCIRCILIFHVYPVLHFLPPQGPPSTILPFFFRPFYFPKEMYNQKMRSGDGASRTKFSTLLPTILHLYVSGLY